jgi:AcrR family transcriptional regulator
MTATRDLIYDRGIERVAILDITDAAGVAAGSFYNYFENKPAIVAAIVDDFHEVFEAHLSETRLRLKDPAMRLSVSLKYYFTASQDNDDVSLGVRGGRFKTDSVAITQSLIIGMANHVALEIQCGRLPKTAVFEAVRHILRMLGLPDIAAKAFAEAPLPKIATPIRDDLPADPNIPFRLAIERRKVT